MVTEVPNLFFFILLKKLLLIKIFDWMQLKLNQCDVKYDDLNGYNPYFAHFFYSLKDQWIKYNSALSHLISSAAALWLRFKKKKKKKNNFD